MSGNLCPRRAPGGAKRGLAGMG